MGFFRKKTLHFFKIAHFGEASLEWVSKDIIASEIWKSSEVGAFWKNTWVFSWKYLILSTNARPSNSFEECVSNGISVWKIWNQILDIFGKTDCYFRKKNLDWFWKWLTPADFLQNASPILLLLKSSENVKDVFSREKTNVQKTPRKFSKTINTANFI